ncbi:CHAT domain-containing protein [Pseudomonas anatoliensis]|uniref:CHAT domain-containing protein n=1 Tax=Pseudomonas anatoliensis TaxID=2710589 RepID=UPI001B33DB44|nr:CHAT domain-containing protein [Pseudomonas anatoliensis]MBP5958139.1 CHAT domain-containing protein [Pseudomonas anatoliensis]
MDSTEKQTAPILGFDAWSVLSKISKGGMGLFLSTSTKQVLGRLIKQSLSLRYTETEDWVFSGFTAVLPPPSATKLNEGYVLDALSTAFLDLSGSVLSDTHLTTFRKAIEVVHSTSLEITDLTTTVSRIGSNRFIFVAEASKYRDKDVLLPPAFGLSSVRSPEDIWVRHVAILGKALIPLVESNDGYTFVHVSEAPLHKAESLALLEEIPGDIWQAEYSKSNPEQELNRNAERWISMVVTGFIDEVRDEVLGLGLSDITTNHIFAQLLSRAGREDELLSVIDKILVSASDLAAAERVQLAALAIDAGGLTRARDLLAIGVEDLIEEEWFEKALDVAIQLRSDELIIKIDQQMSTLFPQSDILRENRDRRLLLNCRSMTNKSFEFSNAGFSHRHEELWRALKKPDAVYEKVISMTFEWGGNWQELASLCCAAHAQSVTRTREAVEISTSVTISKLYGRQATHILLSSVRRLMLKQEIESSESDYYRKPLSAAIRYLAQNPQDGKIRAALISLLTVEACGEIAVPIAAMLALNMASEGVNIAEHQTTRSHPNETHGISIHSLPGASESAMEIDDPQFSQVVEAGLSWINRQRAAEFGVTRLPLDLVGSDPDGVVKQLNRILYLNGSHGPEDTDLQFLDQMVLLTCAIAPHANFERNGDFSALRLLACQNALHGSAQHARNLCEQMLLMGQASPIRKRLAWAAFADVYHRCRKPVEALIGVACAMATDSKVSAADLWQEVHTFIRVLRDLGLITFARDLIPTLKQLMEQLGHDPSNDPRIITLELSLKLFEVRDNDINILSDLADSMGSNCKSVLESPSNLVPAVTLLAQIVLKCDSAGAPVSDITRNILAKALASIGANLAQFVSTVSSISPTPAHVVDMYNKVQRAISAGDAPADFVPVTIAARRLLDGAQDKPAEAQISALAAEILAEQGVELPGELSVLTCEWPLAYAQELSRRGLEVVFLSLNSQDELLVTYVLQGEVHQVEQPILDRSFLKRMQVWLDEYPKAYGFIEASDGIDEFHESMEKLGVKIDSQGQLLIIAEPMLQQLAMNLIVVEPLDGTFNYFLGSKSAIGITPSLSWLSQVRGSARKGRGGYKAWISAEENSIDGGALGIVLDRLKDTFSQYNFAVDTGRKLPLDVSDASLVVACAHGGLSNSGKFIHTISDEDSLVESPGALAQALRGVELVILFVCSGGRLDKHPFDNSTVGLPKQLLNQGCRAVVASPWPLDVKVTYNWLEPFMQAWEAGETVLSATKMANDAVTRRLGEYPQYCLAMTVYGDVLLSKEK